MNTKFMLKLAASSLIVGTIGTGCSQTGDMGVASASSVAKQDMLAAKSAAKANKYISKRDFDKAVGAAEVAVEAAPNNVGYRLLLGQSYLSAGRFASAEAAFGDVLTLDAGNAKAALNLALAQIASGHNDAAIRTLDTHRTNLSAADYGLAIALAGDPAGAVTVLEVAARDGRADTKLRQNLALAYALAGKWNHARVMAAQDLSPDMLDARMTQWASFVRPKAASQQVASLLGVTPANDPGQPERLALRAANTQTAMIDVPVEAPVEQIVEVAAVPVVEATPAPVFEMAAKPDVVEAPAPLIRSEATPLKQVVLPAAPTMPKVAAAKPVSAPRAIESGRYVVQLGAFASPSRAEFAWNKAVNKTRELAGYQSSTAKVKAKTGTLYRASVSGFETRASASQICAKVRAAGGACFIRSNAGDAPTQWVQRGGKQVASR
jgi:Flp pilus assembly protein TadD/cell division protein FtsN